MNFPDVHYFETSALNWLTDRLTIQDAIATKAFQNVRGRGWFLSPTVLFELITTTEYTRRESLIQLAQHLFEPTLLPSEEELLVAYIEGGCPLVEPRRPLRCELQIQAIWEDVCRFKGKTLFPDRNRQDRATQRFRTFAALLYRVLRHRSLDIRQFPDGVFIQVRLQGILDKLSILDAYRPLTPEHADLFRMTAFYALIILCNELTPNPEPIRAFWKRQGLSSVGDRAQFLLECHPTLIVRGPLQNMALMTITQAEGRFSRGMLFDSLHSVYVTYSERVYTTDQHFSDLRERYGKTYPAFSRIRLLQEQILNNVDRENQAARSFIAES